MNENNNKNNTLLLTVIAVATLLVAVIGATFAYFTANISGTESASTLVVNAATLRIAFAEGDAGIYTNEAVEPSKTGAPFITKNFTLTSTNDTDMYMPYTLNLDVDQCDFNKTVDDTHEINLKYTLTGTSSGSGDTVVNTTTKTTVPDKVASLTIYNDRNVATTKQGFKLGDGTFAPHSTEKVHTYQLKFFFDDNDKNQDYDKNKNFVGYVDISTGNPANQIRSTLNAG